MSLLLIVLFSLCVCVCVCCFLAEVIIIVRFSLCSFCRRCVYVVYVQKRVVCKWERERVFSLFVVPYMYYLCNAYCFVRL